MTWTMAKSENITWKNVIILELNFLAPQGSTQSEFG